MFYPKDDSIINLSNAQDYSSQLNNISLADTIKQDVDYKLLYDNQNIYIDRLISTIYWAIGSIFAITAVVVGGNLFLYNKFNKEKYEALLKSNENSFYFFRRNIMKFGLKRLEEIKKDYKTIIDETINDRFKLIDNKYSVQYSDFTNFIRSMIIDLSSHAITSEGDSPFIIDYDILKNRKILWVDDKPENNSQHLEVFTGFGVIFDLVKTTKEAMAKLNTSTTYDLIISNMGRPTDSNRAINPKEGLDFLEFLRQEKIKTPVIIYTKPANISLYGDTVNGYQASITQGFTGLFKEILRKIGKYNEHMGK